MYPETSLELNKRHINAYLASQMTSDDFFKKLLESNKYLIKNEDKKHKNAPIRKDNNLYDQKTFLDQKLWKGWSKSVWLK